MTKTVETTVLIYRSEKLALAVRTHLGDHARRFADHGDFVGRKTSDGYEIIWVGPNKPSEAILSQILESARDFTAGYLTDGVDDNALAEKEKSREQRAIQAVLNVLDDNRLAPRVANDRVLVDAPYGNWLEWDLTFDKLSQLAEEFETHDINLAWSSGWEGSDVTPGDPAALCLSISLENWE